MIEFFAQGHPSPQGSKRHLGRGILVESSKTLKPWRQDVKFTAMGYVTDDWATDKPVDLELTFYFKRPASHYGTGKNRDKLKPSAPEYPTSAAVGDVDKLCRAVCDALTGVAFDDDRQVICLKASKSYAMIGMPEGAQIKITHT